MHGTNHENDVGTNHGKDLCFFIVALILLSSWSMKILNVQLATEISKLLSTKGFGEDINYLMCGTNMRGVDMSCQ